MRILRSSISENKEDNMNLEDIRKKYAYPGDAIFIEAVRYVYDVGKRNLSADAFENARKEVNKKWDEYDEEDKQKFVIRLSSRNLEMKIIDCAEELIECDMIDLLTFANKQMYFGGIDRQRAERIAHDLIDWISENHDSVYDIVGEVGISDDELYELGDEWMIPEEE